MLPKLLIWDWNGTILDDTDLCLGIENELLTERGMRPVSKTWYLDHFTFPIRTYYERMGYTFETETYLDVSAQFMERYYARCPECGLRPGVFAVLSEARARGITQTLLSVTEQSELLIETARAGVDGFFSEILGTDDALGFSKVDRAKAYMTRAGIDPRDALFIGDTDHDVEAANAVGCPCVLLEGGHQSRAVLQRCGAPVYASADALYRALFG
ncbi:MAG: HAD family hydrolase [Clostridia bacterium]|nr:HAD family hydrolase [Clostridia bacterium]